MKVRFGVIQRTAAARHPQLASWPPSCRRVELARGWEPSGPKFDHHLGLLRAAGAPSRVPQGLHPMPTVAAAGLGGRTAVDRSSSQQATLDAFFGHPCADGAMTREVSDRAFAKARSHLHAPAVTWLNERLVSQADAAGLLPRWRGLRLVAADASVLMPAIRPWPAHAWPGWRRCTPVRVVPARGRTHAARGRALGLRVRARDAGRGARQARPQRCAAAGPRLPRGLADQPAQRARHPLRHALRYLGRRLEGAARVHARRAARSAHHIERAPGARCCGLGLPGPTRPRCAWCARSAPAARCAC